MSFFPKICLFTFLVSFQFVYASDVEKVIGENDLVAVDASASNIPLRYRALVDAFGQISMGCTATHIGNGYVLTAGHCFEAGETAIQNQTCDDTTIEWGVREGATSYLKSKCLEIIVAQRNDQNDYALIKVSPVPPVAIAPDIKRHAAIGDSVTIFSHPEELPLRWSGACGIERLHHPDLPDSAIQHKCDTKPGSSGATIIDVVTLKVVGIHDGGMSAESSIQDGSPLATGMNYGTFILSSPLGEILQNLGFN